jgi:hypothetical protein
VASFWDEVAAAQRSSSLTCPRIQSKWKIHGSMASVKKLILKPELFPWVYCQIQESKTLGLQGVPFLNEHRPHTGFLDGSIFLRLES